MDTCSLFASHREVKQYTNLKSYRNILCVIWTDIEWLWRFCFMNLNKLKIKNVSFHPSLSREARDQLLVLGFGDPPPPFSGAAPSPWRPAAAASIPLQGEPRRRGERRRVGGPVASAAASVFSSRPSLSSPHTSSASHGREEEAPPRPVVDLRSPRANVDCLKSDPFAFRRKPPPVELCTDPLFAPLS
ncbi:hypothetical protein BS78_06G267500 [Paspalum vaginatum]|nr:hypothetical protein BS78_06G267500 [Paspalum vaginatum]